MSKVDDKYELTGTFDGSGKTLALDHPGIMKKIMRNLVGEKLLIVVQKLRYKRSEAQNRYIWGVMVPCVRMWFRETTGETPSPDEAYVWLRVGLLGYKAEIKMLKGVEIITMTGKRFSQMNTKEFAEAVDTMIKLLDEKGCFVPLPKKDNFITDFSETDD